MSKKYYHGLTIGVETGKTNWSQKPYTNKKDLIKHLKKYVHRNCHLIIYQAKSFQGLIFDEHISNFKGGNNE